MNIVERFLNYVKFDTQSSEESESVPSTSKQLVFAEFLKKELESDIVRAKERLHNLEKELETIKKKEEEEKKNDR